MNTDELISIIKNECYIFDPTDLDKTIMVNTALDQVISILNERKVEEKYEDIPMVKKQSFVQSRIHKSTCEKYEDMPIVKHPDGYEYCHDFFNEGENSILISEPMCGKKLEYANRIKITNTEFDRDDPEFLINLELSVRSYNCLRRAGIFSINDFCKLDKDSLMHVKNLGRRSYAEIAYALKEHGVIISDILKTAQTYYPYFDNTIFYQGGLKWNGDC